MIEIFGRKLEIVEDNSGTYKKCRKDIDHPGKLKRLIYIEGNLYSSQN